MKLFIVLKLFTKNDYIQTFEKTFFRAFYGQLEKSID